jgi:hypothetical protein
MMIRIIGNLPSHIDIFFGKIINSAIATDIIPRLYIKLLRSEKRSSSIKQITPLAVGNLNDLANQDTH